MLLRTRGVSFAFTFSACLFAESSRGIHWDRDDAIVTRRFDYIKDSHTLAAFFWRYAHVDRRLQGYDPSISSATPDDIRQIRDVEKRFRDDNSAHHKFCVAMVPGRDDNTGCPWM
jgi:hypothetical protein